MSGMLSAIPKTPLHHRLAEEGRLDHSDVSEYGTNVIPQQMSREELLDGYIRVLNELYEPQGYFDRTDALFLTPSFDIGWIRSPAWKKMKHRWIFQEISHGAQAFGLFVRLMALIPRELAGLRKMYRQRLWNFMKTHRTPRPGLVLFYVFHMAMHYHAFSLAKRNSTRESKQLVNSF